MDKNALMMIIAGLVLLAAGIYGAWYFLDELMFVVKGLVGIIIALAGIFILVIGIFTVKD